MKLALKKGSADVTLVVFIQDSSSSTGAGLTGLAYNTSGLVCYYVRPGSAAAQLTLATQTVTGAHSDGGFVEIDSTNMPGVYRLDLSDAIVASGVNSVVIALKGATNMAPCVLEIQLTSMDLNDAVRGGMTALPNANADAAGGVPISDAGGLNLDTLLGRITGNVALASVCTETRLSELDAANIPTDLNNIETDTQDLQTQIGTAGAGLTGIPWNSAWDAEVESEVNDALVALGLDHLVSAAVAGVDVADNSIFAKLVSKSATADWDSFDNESDSLEALRDRGDAAWITGGGGSITDMLNVIPLIPSAIDLANTATWRLGLMLTNALDDLPSTAEITPGTIDIDRKASGGTSWSSVVSGAACSEIAGLVYYDEVFDSGTGYAAGDSIRITFKSQKITVAANDYEVIGATGRIFYTEIKSDAGSLTEAGIADAVWDEATSGHTTGGTFGEQVKTDIDAILADTNELQSDDVPGLIAALNDPTAAAIADAVWDEAKSGHVGAGSFGEEVQAHSLSTEISALNDPTAAAIADAVWDELATGHTDAGKAGAQLWTDIDAILADTNELQSDDVPGLIAALNDPTAAAIADAVWDEAATGHTDAGKAGAQLWTDIDAILVDTNELQGDLTEGGRLDLLIDQILADTNELQTDDVPGLIAALNDPTAAAIADAVWDEAATGHTDAGKAGAQLWTDIDAILADTNELQSDDVPGLIAALNDPTAAAIADAVWDEAKSGHVGAGSFGEEVQAHSLSSEISGLNDLSSTDVAAAVWDAARATYNDADSMGELMNDLWPSVSTIVTGTVQADAGNSPTQVKTDLSSSINDHYNGRIMILRSTSLANQASDITDYVGATNIVTTSGFTSTPSNGTTFVVV